MPPFSPQTGTGSAQPSQDLQLIPYPQHVSLQGAPWRVPPSLYLHVPVSTGVGLRRRAQIIAGNLSAMGLHTQLQSTNAWTGLQAVLTPSPTVSKRFEQFNKPLRGATAKPEGYRLTVTGDGAVLQGDDERGFFYAGQTLRQMIEDDREVPGMVIEDAPLLPWRAVHLDMRGWPPTREQLEQTIDRLSTYKINMLILEYERHFSFNSQPGLSSPDALSPSYLAELELFAQDRGMTLVPLLQCLGHVGHLLKLDPYKELREVPTYWQQFCPSHPSTLEIYSAMVEDLLLVHPGAFFHIGGDEARFLGSCPACGTRAKQIGGRSSLYLEFVGKLVRHLNSRNRQVMLWDEVVRGMTDEQIQWLPQQTILVSSHFSGQGGRATPAILTALDLYKKLGRTAWGAARRWPSSRYEGFDNIDAWTEAAELGYIGGLITTTWTREYAMGPLLAPPEISWPLALYAAERTWGGRKSSTREAFLARVGSRFFGLRSREHRERLWDVYDLLLRDFPREAHEHILQIYKSCTRNQLTLAVADAWCRLGAFEHYVAQFDRIIAESYAHLQASEGDPFHAGRLRWRIEDLKSKAPEIMKVFRDYTAALSPASSAEEYLNCHMAYCMRRLDDLAEILAPYPLPEKEWQQPVRV